jgi:hypothetical protein
MQTHADRGGNTSVRNNGVGHLKWKTDGYYQRNRDLGQVFTPERTFRLDAIVLRTGPDDNAVKSGAPHADVFIQFFEVLGTPRINDNGTPQGADAKHGFSANHRCDDFVEGVAYRELWLVSGGNFPDILPTRDRDDNRVNGDAGQLVYMRWDLTGRDEVTFAAGRRYAFMVGFTTPGRGRAFTLANANRAGVDAAPRLTDSHDRYQGGWGLRREGDGTLPPTMHPGDNPPRDNSLDLRLLNESLFGSGWARYSLPPTTDGYPDVDTYRDLEFYLEVHWLDPPLK